MLSLTPPDSPAKFALSDQAADSNFDIAGLQARYRIGGAQSAWRKIQGAAISRLTNCVLIWNV
jgi:hypothetical protein